MWLLVSKVMGVDEGENYESESIRKLRLALTKHGRSGTQQELSANPQINQKNSVGKEYASFSPTATNITLRLVEIQTYLASRAVKNQLFKSPLERKRAQFGGSNMLLMSPTPQSSPQHDEEEDDGVITVYGIYREEN